MEPSLLALRVVLIGVLATAAVAKLGHRAATAESARALGVPRRWSRPVATLLPVVELSLAALLLPQRTFAVAAALAAALFLAFTVAVARTLARGGTPECNCFGQLTSAPIGRATVARNVALLVAAAAVAAAPRGPALWDANLVAVLTGIVVLEAVALTSAITGRRDPPTHATPGAILESGTSAPHFEVPSTTGGIVSLSNVVEDGLPAVLVFTSSNCASCADLLPDLARWQQSYESVVSVVPLGIGPAADNKKKADSVGLRPFGLDEDGSVARSFGYTVTPAALVVAPDGTITSELVSGTSAIRRLVAATLAGARSASEEPPLGDLAVGDAAPGFTLDTLHDHPVSSADFAGRLVVTVFWDVACGYCQELLPDLRQWEAARTADVHLLLVATGTPEGLQAQGWRSHVALDPGAVVTRAFGAYGTPSAVLVDAEGRLASDLAVGGEAVLALARRAEELARLADAVSR